MLWTGFVFGLLGSFHCVGMCGAIALALPGQQGTEPRRFLGGRLLYHLGRVSTYAALGTGAGLVGTSLRLAGVQQSLSIASGVLILLLVAVPERYTGRLAAALGLARPLAWVKPTLASLFQRNTLPALYATGLLNGLLPCGLVYLALMLGLTLSGQLVPPLWRGRLRRAVPYAASVLALLFIVRGLGLGIPYLSPLQAAPETAAAQPHTVLYCH